MRTFFIVVLSVLYFSCDPAVDVSLEKSAFSQAVKKWNNFQIENYRVTERISCFCYGVLVKDVYVQNGLKQKVEFDESTLPEGQTYEAVFNQAKTIEDAFLFIENVFKQHPDSILIEYDPEYGFPTAIHIDYDFNMADDEITYNYTNFEILINQ